MPHPENREHVGDASRSDRGGRDPLGRSSGRSTWPGDRRGRSGSNPESLGLDPALLDLVEETTRRLLDGEPVDVERLVEGHPGWAEELRSLMPAMRGLAELSDGGEELPGDARDEDGRTAFGKFRILREVGRGGMGIVYEAEQVALRRRVALKILPQALAMDPRAMQRFRLEAQVAGWLQHPRVVPVHDVGLVRGVPYYAMRFIEGGSLADLVGEIRRAVDGDRGAGGPPPAEGLGAVAAGLLSGRLAPPRREHDGSRSGPIPAPAPAASAAPPGVSGPPSIGARAYLRAVAALGMDAAGALGYAHDQGVVHRDIKPANLLVDFRGELWVADFGMAAVQGNAGLTATGDLPGTLRYMSPEQALGKRALVDRRSDVYSLGATLYELLTLRPAISGDDHQQIFRMIAEGEPAPIRRLNPAVPSDLATIVAKAMARDPSDRYETALQLSEDLGRFLDGRPIVARPVGPLSRAWRWCRRRPLQAGLVGSLVVALAVGFAGVTWGWREAVRQKRLLLVAEREARAETAKADAVNRFLIEGLIHQAEPASNPAEEPVTLLEVLDRAAGRVDSAFPGQPEMEAAIQLAIGRSYHGLGEYHKGEAHFRAALGLFESRGDVDEGAGRLEASAELGHVLSHLGRRDEALATLSRVRTESRRVLGPLHAVTLQSALYLAEVLRNREELREAEALYRDCLANARRAPEPNPQFIFSARFHLGDVFLRQGKAEEAEALYRELADEQRRELGPEHPHTLTTLNNLGAALNRQARFAEAERLFRECLETDRRILGEHHPDTVTALYNLGHVLNEQGRPDEAEPLIRRSVEERRWSIGPENPDTLYVTSSLADLLRDRGRLDEAEEMLRSCLAAQRRILGPDHRDTLQTAHRLDRLIEDRSRSASAPAPSTLQPGMSPP
ncbi:tetratricopeptide repeat protein [Tautonia plasticadhaerens]|uniref:Serine/threonine-protein kinase PknH n=1 Tax=Tautonia plasticadhaerens TaxID=2527974 RepID=A0A518HEB1_9BACT|nr:serine/threonine-protein kinase [Tautonia plasticadhaerens]QDV39162.1 Serine/threonine-protein kinase PknH [Tautonia plasticadhaerens]